MQEDYKKIINEELSIESFITTHYNFFKKIVVDRCGCMNEDYLQESLLLFLQYLPKYDEEKGSLSTYLYKNIYLKLGRYMWEDVIIRKPCWLFDNNVDKTRTEVISMNQVVKNNNSNNSKDVFDIIEKHINVTYDTEEYIVSKVHTEDIMKRVLDCKRSLILNLSLDKYTLNEIGDMLGMGQKNVHRLLSEAKSKIRERYYYD